jgi:hypothetical protein
MAIANGALDRFARTSARTMVERRFYYFAHRLAGSMPYSNHVLGQIVLMLFYGITLAVGVQLIAHSVVG